MSERAPKSKPKPAEKDPHGGLTAAGRAAFHAKDGSNLRPGVRKSDAEMTPEDMKRKGSWAVRFYGRDPLPPLVDPKGRPTRFALSAHAWGEPVPATEADARRIAERGRRLLDRYRKSLVDRPAAGRKAPAKAPGAHPAPVKPATKKSVATGSATTTDPAGSKAVAKKAVARKAVAKKKVAKKTVAKKTVESADEPTMVAARKTAG